MHSMWGAFVSSQPLAIESISLRFEGENFAVGNIAVSLPQIEYLTQVANTLNARLVPISQFLQTVRPTPGNARLALRPHKSLKIYPLPVEHGRVPRLSPHPGRARPVGISEAGRKCA